MAENVLNITGQIVKEGKAMSNKWEKVGIIGVDAGLCWIGDPCYCVTPDSDEHPAQTWEEFCKKLFQNEKNGILQWNYKLGHAGLGVSIGQFGGDGTYPVYVKRASGGLITEAKIVFDE